MREEEQGSSIARAAENAQWAVVHSMCCQRCDVNEVDKVSFIILSLWCPNDACVQCLEWRYSTTLGGVARQ